MNKELFQGQTFYEVLGLTQEASSDEVSEAYEAKRDELDSLEEVDEVVLQRALTLLERAHGTLIDEERRAEYDETLGELIELEATDAIQTAIKEFDHLPIEKSSPTEANETEENTEQPPADSPPKKSPRLSGRMKATVTVPLSTIARAIEEGGDLEFGDETSPTAADNPTHKSGILIGRRNPEGEVSSYGSVSQSLEATRIRNEVEDTQVHAGHGRNRRPSLEIPRSSVAHLTRGNEEDVEQRTFLDYFLIFCAFILPVATVLLTLIHFLLPPQ